MKQTPDRPGSSSRAALRATAIIDAGCPLPPSVVRLTLENYQVQEMSVGEQMRRGHITWLQDAVVLIFGASHDVESSYPGSLITEIRSKCPHVSILVCVHRLEDVRHRVRRLAVAGVDDFFALEQADESSRLASALQQRLRAPVPAEALRELWRISPSALATTIAAWGLRNGSGTCTVEQATELFQRDATTLNRILQKAGFPTLGTWIRAGALHRAEQLARTTAYSAEQIARVLAFPDAKALYAARRRFRIALRSTTHRSDLRLILLGRL